MPNVTATCVILHDFMKLYVLKILEGIGNGYVYSKAN